MLVIMMSVNIDSMVHRCWGISSYLITIAIKLTIIIWVAIIITRTQVMIKLVIISHHN